MKKQWGVKKRIFHGASLLLLAVVLAMSGMSGIAMAAAGDVWVDNGTGTVAAANL